METRAVWYGMVRHGRARHGTAWAFALSSPMPPMSHTYRLLLVRALWRATRAYVIGFARVS
eukprot:10496396-Lingulodinium_polyedra.AAC.1